jgi:phosphoribosylformylglycinamidine synthase
VVLLGAKTGRDGIGGVSVLASSSFEQEAEPSPSGWERGAGGRRPSVQVGDPFMEKLLIESCLELYEAGLVVGVQDLGGAGLTCALSETAADAGTGMDVRLERVPLREPSMSPPEILASESQERMLLIVTPEHLDTVRGVADKWGVQATAIGVVTDTGRLRITWHGKPVADLPPGSLADDGPVYARPMREPADLVLLQADPAETLPRPDGPEELRDTVLRMAASPNLCDRTWVTEQYDQYVRGNTVASAPADAGVLRLDETTGVGVALSVDGNGRYARLDPYAGAQLALAEAYRNVTVAGAMPVAVTDCLNFGSPEDPNVMWQFAEAVRGLADGCATLGIPVTGGNVSFYNSTGAAAIHPTPIVGVLGIVDDVANRLPAGFTSAGDVVFQLGETREELSGSEWAWVTHGHLGGSPPRVDLEAERRLGAVIAEARELGLIRTAHDLSDGGLAQALVEACLQRGYGVKVRLPDEPVGGAFGYLFSESTARALVSVPLGREKAFTGLCDQQGMPWTALGVVGNRDMSLELRGLFEIPLDELRAAWSAPLRERFDRPAVRPDPDPDPDPDPEPAVAAPEPGAAPEPAAAPEPEASAAADPEPEPASEPEPAASQ